MSFNSITSFQELSERDFEKGSQEEQLLELRRQNEALEGTLDFLEAEKIRLQDKLEKMMAAGKFPSEFSSFCTFCVAYFIFGFLIITQFSVVSVTHSADL